MDFAELSNPAVTMEWTDAHGVISTGKEIPRMKTDTTGGALPGGSIRWGKLGTDNGNVFDLLVTVSDEPSYYSELLAVEYISPFTPTTSQAVLTESGIVCLGFGLRPSYCDSGSGLDAVHATCTDGSDTTMRATEFEFRFVITGTDQTMPAFDRMFATFFDVDGDVVNERSMYELNAVLGSSRLSLGVGNTREAGVFYQNEAEYAIATQNINVRTDFGADPREPAEVSLPAIVSFEIEQLSKFKVLFGGRSSYKARSDRGYCFAMVNPFP